MSLYNFIGFMVLAVIMIRDIGMYFDLFRLNDDMFEILYNVHINRYVFITAKGIGYLLIPYIWPITVILNTIQLFTGKIIEVDLD